MTYTIHLDEIIGMKIKKDWIKKTKRSSRFTEYNHGIVVQNGLFPEPLTLTKAKLSLLGSIIHSTANDK